MDGQLSMGFWRVFDVLRNLRDMQLALFCLILSVSVHHLRSVCQNRSQESSKVSLEIG